ncbi:hypothetical protein LMF32_00865 [Desemzia sp. C1]|uniref:phage structural protein n=1 Tax=unclassified Desemzia TaxID=2685243 RepID=UPI001E318843|nr:hypothetical protein [Desemzia sp. C1]MCI3027687.1 hypothetical protein [Desemzia sp. C1]
MNNTATYDAKSVTVTIDGWAAFGFADGDMVTTSKDNDNVEIVSDAQGFSSLAKNNDKLGTITVQLSQVSPCYPKMMDLALKQKVFPVYVVNGTEKIGGTQGIVTKTPDTNFGKSIGARSFTIKVMDYTHNVK